jgi:surface antigen
LTILSVIPSNSAETTTLVQREDIPHIYETKPLTIDYHYVPEPKPVEQPQPVTRHLNASGRVLSIEKGERYGSGQCVALAQAYGFRVSGNASAWPENAKKAGYTVNKDPKVGSVVVTTESSAGTATGHVALIEKIEDGWIYVKEQNYIRLTVSHGRIPIDSPIIRAYIHK